MSLKLSRIIINSKRRSWANNMRFVDASVFLYAYLKPKKKMLREKVIVMKDRAKEIVRRIDEGENVITTLVHLSEIANIVESKVNNVEAAKVVINIMSKPNIDVLDVRKDEYLEAAKIAKKINVGVNDALAYIVMKKRRVKEIYSFDSDFDKFEDIRRITE